MFYFFSKLLDFLLLPSFWVFILVFIAFIRKKKRKRNIGLALLIYFVFGNSALFNFAIQTLEYPPFEDQLYPSKFETAILLGGYGWYGSNQDDLELNEAADRLNEALRLYRKGKVDKIMVLSGAAPKLFPDKKEGELTERYLMDLGIPQDDLIVETESKNTHENAVMAKELIQTKGLKGPFLLVTSAFHMRRAQACFDAKGILSIPFPTDYRHQKVHKDLSYLILPHTKTMVNWSIVIKEIIGFWVYDLKGYI